MKSNDQSAIMDVDSVSDMDSSSGKDNIKGSETLGESTLRVSSIQKVYTTVEFTRSKSSVTDSDVDFLSHTLRSKEHLRKNIKAFEEGKAIYSKC